MEEAIRKINIGVGFERESDPVVNLQFEFCILKFEMLSIYSSRICIWGYFR